MEVVLNSKSCVQRIIFTRRYYKYAKGVHRDAKVAFTCDLLYNVHISYLFPSQFISDRAYDRFRFQFQPPCSTSSETGRFYFVFAVYTNLTLPRSRGCLSNRPVSIPMLAQLQGSIPIAYYSVQMGDGCVECGMS